MTGARKYNSLFIISPKTKREILVDGPAYQKLNQDISLSNLKQFTKTHPRRNKKLTDTISNQEVKKISAMHINRKEISGDGRGIHTRGWDKVKPKLTTERRLLKSKCGNACFLYPQENGFPICPKCKNGRCKCEIDCRGLLSAKIRANQWGYKGIARSANKINKKIECKW